MPRLSREDVISVIGSHHDDITVAEIIGTGASKEQLMEAEAWLSANDYMGGGLGKHQPAGLIGKICEILAADEEEPEDH